MFIIQSTELLVCQSVIGDRVSTFEGMVEICLNFGWLFRRFKDTKIPFLNKVHVAGKEKR